MREFIVMINSYVCYIDRKWADKLSLGSELDDKSDDKDGDGDADETLKAKKSLPRKLKMRAGEETYMKK